MHRRSRGLDKATPAVNRHPILTPDCSAPRCWATAPGKTDTLNGPCLEMLMTSKGPYRRHVFRKRCANPTFRFCS